MRAATIVAASAAIFGSVNAASHMQLMGGALQRREWTDNDNDSSPPKGTDKPTKEPAKPAADPTTTLSYWGDANKPTETPNKPEGGNGQPEKPEGGKGQPDHGKPDHEKPEGGKGQPDHGKPDHEKPEGGKGQPDHEKPEGGKGQPDHGKPDHEKPEGGKDKPKDTPAGGKAGEKTITVTKTGTLTVTKYVEGEATKPTQEAPKATKEAPKPTKEAPKAAETLDVAKNWASSAPAGAGVDECIITIITKYGRPTWQPTPEEPAATSTSTWEDAPEATKKPTTTETKPEHTWVNVPAQSSPADSGHKSGSGGIGGSPDGNWAVAYTPFSDDGGCASREAIEKDVNDIADKGLGAIRVYSTACNTLSYIGGAAETRGLKLILGVIDEKGLPSAQKQVDEIIAWGQWKQVSLIVIGNEIVHKGGASATDLKAFIVSAKSAFAAAGYTGFVTTTETLAEWNDVGAAWCDVVDVVSANLYAYFNPKITADKAGDFIKAQIEELSLVCPGKEIYVMESGWPSAGGDNGDAVASHKDQKTAVDSIKASGVAGNIVWFSWNNEGWKGAGIEQNFGLKDCL